MGSNPAGAWMAVSCDYYIFSGRVTIVNKHKFRKAATKNGIDVNGVDLSVI